MTSGPSFPDATDTDAEEVSWALSTGQAMWKRGDHAEAIKWIKRASDSAADAGDDDRAFTLARAAAELKAATGTMTVPPPPPAPAAAAPPPAPAAVAPPPAPAAPPAPAPVASAPPAVPAPPAAAQTARIAPPPPARGSGSVAPPAKPGPTAGARPSTGMPAAAPTAGAVKPPFTAAKPATTTPLPSAGARPAPGATATPLPKPGGKPVGSIGTKAAEPAKSDVPPPPPPRSQIPTPTEEHAAPTFSDDLDAPTMMLTGGALEPEAPTKAFPKDVARELTSTHVWIFRDETGRARVAARSGRKPAGALDAVMVTSDGAALSMMLDEA